MKVLALSPHTDDVEIGAGAAGALARRAATIGVKMTTGHWKYDKERDVWGLWIHTEEVIRAIRTKNHGTIIASRIPIPEWVQEYMETLERWVKELFEKSDIGDMEYLPFGIGEENEKLYLELK